VTVLHQNVRDVPPAAKRGEPENKAHLAPERPVSVPPNLNQPHRTEGRSPYTTEEVLEDQSSIAASGQDLRKTPSQRTRLTSRPSAPFPSPQTRINPNQTVGRSPYTTEEVLEGQISIDASSQDLRKTPSQRTRLTSRPSAPFPSPQTRINPNQTEGRSPYTRANVLEEQSRSARVAKTYRKLARPRNKTHVASERPISFRPPKTGTNPQPDGRAQPLNEGECLGRTDLDRRESPRPTENRRDRRYAVPKLTKDARPNTRPPKTQLLKGTNKLNPPSTTISFTIRSTPSCTRCCE
jgi:hypothetical protein